LDRGTSTRYSVDRTISFAANHAPLHLRSVIIQSKDVQCTITLSAETKEELLEAAAEHGKKFHGYEDPADFRENMVKEFEEGAASA
jgi:predicted small metal-binding protein